MKKPILLLIVFLLAAFCYAGGKPVLDNGVKVIDIKRPYTDTISIVFFVKGGISRETQANNGIGSLFTSVWIKSNEILKKVEFYGGSVYASMSPDFMEVTLAIPSEQFDRLFGYYVQLISNPVIDEDVFKREQALQKEEIISVEDNPSGKSYKNFSKATYGSHPYSLAEEGTMESVSSLTVQDMKNYAKEMLMGANITLAVAGNYSGDELERIRAAFSFLPKGTAYKPSCAESRIEKDTTVEDTDKNVKQAKLYIGYNAPDAADPEYPAVKVIADILGGGMSSRYFNALRKDKGYAYSVGSIYASRLCSSRFVSYIGLDYANVPDAIASIEKINKEFINDLTPQELESVKNYMLGKILTDSQTNAKQAWYACFFENVGLKSTFFSNYIDVLKNISADDIKKAAKIFDGPKTVYILK